MKFLLSALCLAPLILIGCGGKTQTAGTDSNSNWLSRCTENADCTGGLSCLCNICTKACEQDGVCSEAGQDITCIEPSDLQCVAKAAGICAGIQGSEMPDASASGGGPGSGGASGTGGTPAGGAGSGEPSEPDASAPDPADCATLDEAACEAAPSCAPITGWPIAAGDPPCLLPSQYAGCGEAGVSCPPAISTAVTADGTCWSFGDCVPAGFTRTEACYENGPVASQACEDENAPPLQVPKECVADECDYCYDLSEADCHADASCFARQAARVSPEPYCAEPQEFFRCEPHNAACDEAEAVLQVDGQCWYLNCIPGGIDDGADCRVNDEYPEQCAP